jgi:hypothetical protein
MKNKNTHTIGTAPNIQKIAKTENNDIDTPNPS